MSQVEITYSGSQQCVAINTKNAKRVAIDCPATKGAEFGPDSLVAARLGSCMLISMASFAVRHGLDIAGARADVDVSLGGKPETRISAIDETVRVPKTFTDEEQANLEKAAGAYPIRHGFRPDTDISTHFQFGSSLAEAS